MKSTEPSNIKVEVTPFVDTMPADLLTPLAVYLKLSARSTHSFLLESVEGGKSLARYSFIGADPVEVLSGGQAAYTQIREHFATHFAESDQKLPAFIGGAIGYLGFDACEWFEPSLAGESDAGECAFMFYRSIVAFDHARQVIKIVSLDLEGEEKAAEARNAEIRSVLEQPNVPLPAVLHHTLPQVVLTESNWKREDFESAVKQIKELINAGECYQTVLSQCFTRPTTASAVAIYRAIRSLNPSPYMFLLDFDEKQVIGASPEMLVRCEGERLEYRPIAGTRHRGKTAAEDDALGEEMRLDKKEVAEHLMLVDLGRNDLGRVAEYGSVTVDTLMSVEKYSHVQHLVSSLSAKLRKGLDRFDALASCFPAGTVSGAPKVRSIEIIRELEPTPRGIYAGAVGYFDYTGNMDTCIAIRTLVLEDGVAKIQAGAGIVADSVPELEFEETINKAKGLLRAIEIAEQGL
ncbi:MAG: anthranilate synthase component I family protein [Acidobacteria bacterium]|nr:anthranilate synthase component I family protein [Acidobacteriota bacterium]